MEEEELRRVAAMTLSVDNFSIQVRACAWLACVAAARPLRLHNEASEQTVRAFANVMRMPAGDGHPARHAPR